MARCTWMLCLLATACATGPQPASPLAVDRQVRRLLGPFQTPRGMVCDELLIEITANFNEMIMRPAVGGEGEQVTREEGDGFVEYRWVNPEDNLRLRRDLRFGIVGNDRFPCAPNEIAVLRSARLRIRETGELTFRITARGEVTVQEGEGQRQRRRNLRELRIEDGLVVES